jgi:hypothetical protein
MKQSSQATIMAQLRIYTPEVYDDYAASKALLEIKGWKVKRRGRKITLEHGDLTIEGDYTTVMAKARTVVQR